MTRIWLNCERRTFHLTLFHIFVTSSSSSSSFSLPCHFPTPLVGVYSLYMVFVYDKNVIVVVITSLYSPKVLYELYIHTACVWYWYSTLQISRPHTLALFMSIIAQKRISFEKWKKNPNAKLQLFSFSFSVHSPRLFHFYIFILSISCVFVCDVCSLSF